MVKPKKIAIDVVILPPEDVKDRIIGINQQMADKGDTWGIMLRKDDFLPHLSLAMGCIYSDKLKVVKNIIEDIAKKFPPISLEFSRLHFEKDQMGLKNYSLLIIENNAKLKKLHEALMDGLQPLFSCDCKKESLYSKPGEFIEDPEYINDYSSRYSYNAFLPHITIRTKEALRNDIFPIKFMATTVAACHVGIGTTCRKVLFSTELKNGGV